MDYLKKILEINELKETLEEYCQKEKKELSQLTPTEVLRLAKWKQQDYFNNEHYLNLALQGKLGIEEQKKTYREARTLNELIAWFEENLIK